MRTRIGDIRANPFRNIDRYPIDREKVEKLKGSINRTEFWDNIVGRIGPDGPEIGYGHHRLVALRDLYPPEHQIDLIVRDLDDEAMLHVMADENMQEWAASSAVIVETVRAVRDFLNTSVPGTKYSSPGQPPKSNGTDEIVAFLGWPVNRVKDALSILYAEEAGDLEPEDTADLSIEQADAMRREVKRQIADPVVRRVAIERVRKDLHAGTIGKRGISAAVAEVRVAHRPENGRTVVPAEIAARLYAEIDDYFRKAVVVADRNITRSDLIRLIAENRNAEELSRSTRPWAEQLADALDRHATEARRLAVLLRAEQAVAIGA